ncbi:indole-3-glycerol phosphate synthase TrpC [Brevibacillus sp. SYP-B805]|uniref:indole-3-glycerol phosphate synthase TrpC n=1 Tax=Brevibacillus sp. SYP-B805 TaxID=1578199 RepID=UPI0013EB9A6A|nr:indole-3-glycerol phosphate synthase TrpC [Brevibacillus sp. SYP-B805]NGQ94563.1 indole-3-glycerol phosphate synthase TrpC [Brevibacillus sp. SYP-B805]
MLRKIVETKKEEVARLHQRTSLQELMAQAAAMSAPRGFHRALQESPRPVSLIAEVKKASPSKGLIRPDFDPVAIARQYAAAKADAISVLTDQRYFQGDLAYLRQIREAVDAPLLRKDFLLDEWQVVEARAFGADCVLLIAAILEGEHLRHLAQTAASLGMDVLIEVHDRAELETVLRHTTPQLIGINNRNLRTFQVDLQTTAHLIREIPPGITVVSESGIASPRDVELVRQGGARSILVGEHFMRQADIAQAVLDLVGESVSAI